MALPVDIRHDFPFLEQQHAQGRPWVYLDSAATTLKPRQVIDTVTQALSNHSTNVHRSVCGLSDETTELFESARQRIARFIGAQAHEIVFVRNTTEAINIVARCYPRNGATVVSLSEHHSNLLPWRQGKVRELPPLPDGRPDLEAIERELKKGDVSIVSIAHISNVTGFLTDVRSVADIVHRHRAILVVDAAQSAGRVPIDVTDFDCDFLACSGHKMYGPTGVGVLFGKAERLQELRLHQTGGGTVESVSATGCEWRAIPWRFEAGTPAIEAVLGLGSAVDYLQEIGMQEVVEHEQELTNYALAQLEEVQACKMIGQYSEKSKVGVVGFYFQGESSHVVARTLSDRYGICVRSGHHCAQPLHEHLQLSPSLRISFGLYSNKEDVDQLISALKEIIRAIPVRRL